MDRKLSAILAADVVGYSALMERDEAGTFERLKALRRTILEPLVKEHHGRIFKMMGDGFLVEFASVVDAVACAAELQKGLADRNAPLSKTERIVLRIGVNLGDVIVEGKDRHGEGVNIAARLEQLAEPGGICVSQPVIDQLSNKLPLAFDDIGEHRVKNIEKPVHAYRVKLDGAPVKRPAPVPAKRTLLWAALLAAVALLASGAAYWFSQKPAPNEAAVASAPVAADTRPSLVVLPFANLSDDKEQGYLADGITEDLTTDLARVPGLFVISRNAAFTYKGKSVQPAQIASELGVRYILEGSTRRAGDDMRLNAQLIDAETGGHLWAERFDGQWADVFALQDRLVSSIAGALKLRLVVGAGKANVAGGTDNPAAYEAYLRGLELLLRNKPEDAAPAIAYYQQALALDPDFGTAMADLAWAYWNVDEERLKALGLSWDELNAKLYESLEAAARHPSPSYYQIAADLLVRERKSDEAIALLNMAVPLDPSNFWTYEGLSQAHIFNGHPKEGRAYLDTAMRVDPGWNDWRHYHAGLAAFNEGRFEEAAAILERINLSSHEPWPKFYGLQVLLSAYGHLGLSAEIATAKAQFKVISMEHGEGEHDLLLTQRYFVFKNEADIDRLLEGLRKAGVPELPLDFDPKGRTRLTGPEIKSLIFGHELRGRRISPEVDEYRRVTATNGSVNVTLGSENRQGTSWTQAGFLCVAYPKYLTDCGAIYRNPTGSFEHKNEYLFILRGGRLEFSVVK